MPIKASGTRYSPQPNDQPRKFNQALPSNPWRVLKMLMIVKMPRATSSRPMRSFLRCGVSQEASAGPILPACVDALFPLRVERVLDRLFLREDFDFAKDFSKRGDYSTPPAQDSGACYNRAMAGSRALDMLRRVPFLYGIDEQGLLELAASLPQEHFAAGETLFEQGERVDCLFVLLSGRVSLIRFGPEEESIDLGERLPPDMLGAQELVYRRPRTSTGRALEDTTALCWNRGALTSFLKEHSEALAAFQFLAAGEKMAASQPPDWLRPGEVVYAFTRRHSFILYQRLTVPLLLIAASLLLLFFGASSAGSLLIWLGAGLGLAGLLYAAWQFMDWRNDYFLVTDRRAVWIEKVIGIYDSRREAPLHTVLSATVGTDVTSRMLGYGDVVIRTYTGKLTFRNVSHPQVLAALIEELWRRLQAQKESADRSSLVEALEQRLAAGSAAESTDEPAQLEPEARSDSSQGLDHWGFQVRFESGGAITYRKHWAVLLRVISLPSAAVIFTISLIGAQLGGLINLLDLSAMLGLGGLALGIFGLWWLYRYIDWANDIYQVSSQQILDIYKKPLGREERKVAPLENILGTEVDRKGLLGILLNYGDVIANVGTSQFTFEGVFDPVQVQQDIVHAQETLLHTRAELERARRQSEMVELIDIYHERYTKEDSDGNPQGPVKDYGNT
jgi:hypothetical protein